MCLGSKTASINFLKTFLVIQIKFLLTLKHIMTINVKATKKKASVFNQTNRHYLITKHKQNPLTESIFYAEYLLLRIIEIRYQQV